MQGNMLYHEYLKPGTEYYERVQSGALEDIYEITDLPVAYYCVNDDSSVWTYYDWTGNQMPDQGWKIHISSQIKDSKTVLEIVSKICFKHKVAFKHLKDKASFIRSNSKNANRASSGKFIAVYPNNFKCFEKLLIDFSEYLEDIEAGPYILNDKRWRTSNVYYRYGGFKTLLNDKGEHCIRDQQGNLVVDQRTPFYSVPSFVLEEEDYLNKINLSPTPEKYLESNLDRYEIETALSHSNAGGVYLAKKKDDDKKVIIKEARPHAGLDGLLNDAIERQKIEKAALLQLTNLEGVVQFVDFFEEWEHSFLVIEFLEGEDLRSFLAKNYPYTRENTLHLDIHAQKIKVISEQLFLIIDSMHSRGIAMGDVQPANIMINDDLDVHLIDFETAKSVDSTDRPSMATTGFTSFKIKNSAARDWFGFKKILRYLALPLLTSEDLDHYLLSNHLKWIKKQYGEEFYQFFINLNHQADLKIALYQNVTLEKKPEKSIRYSYMDLRTMENLMRTGLCSSLTDDMKLIYGDIRQTETKDGELNYLTGGTGAAFTLIREETFQKSAQAWIDDHLIPNWMKLNGSGLLSGKAGALALILESGNREFVFEHVPEIIEGLNHDLTLRSGMSGIGLFLINLFIETGDVRFLKSAENIYVRIESILAEDEEILVEDWAAVNIGLIDGLSGVSLFYSALYATTSKELYLARSIELLKKDLKHTHIDHSTGIIQTLDERNRLLPYLSGGSIGIAISIWYLNHVTGEKYFAEEFNSVVSLSKLRCTITGGLFDGAGSLLLIPALMGEQDHTSDILNDVLTLLSLFVIDKTEHLSFPGNFSYRLSDDILTGSSGIIMGMNSVLKNNPLYWLPIANVSQFMLKTKKATTFSTTL